MYTIRTFGVVLWILLVSSTLFGCRHEEASELDAADPSSSESEVTIVRAMPFDLISLQGLVPAGSRGGVIGFETGHVRFEQEVTSPAPIKFLVPPYIDVTGGIADGEYQIYWRPGPHAGEPELAPFTSTRPEDAILLPLRLEVRDLMRVDTQAAPGAFAVAAIDDVLDGWDAAFEDHITRAATDRLGESISGYRDESRTQLLAVRAQLLEAREAPSALGALTVNEDVVVQASLSREELVLLDRLFATLVQSTRRPLWRAGVGFAELTPPDTEVMRKQALLSDFKGWFSETANSLGDEAIETAQRLGSVVRYTAAAVTIAGLLAGSTTVAAGAAVVTAVAVLATTAAPAAIATGMRAAGNLVRGEGSLSGLEYDTLSAGLEHVFENTLGAGLSRLSRAFNPLRNTGSALGDAVGDLISGASGWADGLTGAGTDALLDCINPARECVNAPDIFAPSASTGSDGTLEAPGEGVECVADIDCMGAGVVCSSGNCVREGALRFTLQWDAQTDLDLYVQTPGGEILSYQNPGAEDGNGALDRDNTTGGAGSVENIFFEQRVSGSYTYWAQNFNGAASASFTLSIFENERQVNVLNETLPANARVESRHLTHDIR